MNILSRFMKGSSISQVILLALFCVSIIPIIVVSMVVIDLSNGVLAEQMVENIQVLVQIRAEEIDNNMIQAETTMARMSPAVTRSLDALVTATAFENEPLHDLFIMALASNPAAQSILIILPNGTAFEIEVEENGRFLSTLDTQTKEVYQAVTSLPKATPRWIQPQPSADDNEKVVTLAMPLLNTNGEPLAVLAQMFNVNDLYQSTETDSDLLENAVYNFLITPQGNIFSSLEYENDESFALLDPLLSSLETIPSTSSSVAPIQDELTNEYLLISTPLQAEGWATSAVVVTELMVPPASPVMRARVLQLMIAEVVFVVIMAVLLIRMIHHPLKSLLLGVEQLSQDGHAQQVSVNSFQELTHLAQAFNKMAAKVWERETTLKASVARLRIKIDSSQKKQQVESLIETDFFKELELNAARLRNKLKRE